jgi:hypothetical protein
MAFLDWRRMFDSDKITINPKTSEYLSEISSIFTEPVPPPVRTIDDVVKFSAMDVDRAQVAAYESQLRAYTAATMSFAKQQEMNPMPNNKVLFSVHIATNGYYAVSDSGIMVVETTLSGVCAAMQAALADEAARSDMSLKQASESDVNNGWQQIT